jgi:DNA repair exonuclease SbcCD ATPase subunit
MATPGEFAAKVSVAWQVFWQRFPVLVQQKAKDAARRVVDDFGIGLAETVITEDGLVLVAKTDNPTALFYEEIYDWMGSQVGGDARKAVLLYSDINRQLNRALTLDIELRVPHEVSDALALAFKAAELIKNLPQRLADLESEARKSGDNAGRALSTAVIQAGNVTRAVVDQLLSAGVEIDITTEAKRRLEQLAAGMPKLDWHPDELGKQLNQIGRQANIDAAKHLAEEAARAIQQLQALQAQIEEAVKRGAEQLAWDLKKKAEELQSAIDQTNGDVKAIEQRLTDSGLEPLPPDICQPVAHAIEEAGKAMDVIRNAPSRAAEQAQKIAAGLLDAFGNVIQSVGNTLKGWLGL